jgi:hypothetical protein
LVCRFATAYHLYEEFFGLQCITSYRRIKQQSNRMACYQRPTLVLTIYHTSELATSLAASTRLHILGLQSYCPHPMAAVAAPASVPQQGGKAKIEQWALVQPSRLRFGHSRGSIRFVHRGRTILDSPCSPHLTHVSAVTSSDPFLSRSLHHTNNSVRRRCSSPL